MSLGKEARLVIVAAALCAGGVWWFSTEKREAPLTSETAVMADWKVVDVQSLKWSSEKLRGRVPSMTWTVEYEYVVEGTLHKGHHINARLTALRVGYGDYPIDMTVRLNEIQSVWYDPNAPSRSAVFKSAGTDIGSELRDTYAELTVRAKQEGRWP